jgi:Beta-lactamase enzyme family
VIEAPPLPPPAIVAPAPRETSFGLVSGTAPAGTRRVIVHVGGRIAADKPLRGRSFSVNLREPGGLTRIRVTAVDGRNRRASSSVEPVYVLPSGAGPRDRAPRLDPALADPLRSLARSAGGTAAVYVEDLRSGRGAAWNARARFPAASTLKLAIAVAAMRALDGKPAASSALDTQLREMLMRSDNAAANAVLVWLAGSTSAGGFRVDETMRALGLVDSLMYGGYEVERRPSSAATPIPIRVESQPTLGPGKYTTAWDLARLARAVYLAAAGKGPLLRLGVSGSEARYLLYLLAQASDRGKLDRFLGGHALVLHKSGWLPTVRHDNGIVVFAGGAFVASVLTFHSSAGDELAGRVALYAYQRYSRR